MRHLYSVALASAMAVAAGPAMAVPNYHLLTTIAVPSDPANNQPGGQFNSFDISYFDPVTGNDYVADRSNASVDIFSGSSNTFLGRATGFTGQGTVAAPFPTKQAGADGVVTVTSGGTTTLYAGNGDSTLRVFNATNPAAPTQSQSISTGGLFRVDEMAYSPATQQVLAANNADAPAFGTLFATTGGSSPVSIAHTGISIPGAANTDGLEQPVWNPNTGSFFISVPAFNGDQGGIAEIKTDGTVGALTKFASIAGGPATCSPAGLAVGGSGNLMVGCGSGQAVLLHIDPTTHVGSVVKLFPQISGTDELWYDPNTGDFYVTGKDTSGNRVFDVISDATDSLLQSVLLPVSASSNPHSISVDPFNGDVFVPLAGTTFNTNGTVNVPNDFCPLGCIAVFSAPEPGSLPILIVGLAGLFGLAVRRRVQSG
jgi:hypothetical protein